MKSLWRKDGARGGAKGRWGSTQRRLKRRAAARRRSGLRPRRVYRARRRHSLTLHSGAPHSTQQAPQGQLNTPQDPNLQDPNLQDPNQPQTHPLSPQGLADLSAPPPLLWGWIEGLELEGSTTLWGLSIPLIESDQDDWSAAEARPRYTISPTPLYRARLGVYSSLVDLNLTYESRLGLSLLGERGSLLGLALAAPALIPQLAPLSLHYQRVRFEEGAVSLRDERAGVVERQTFRLALTDYELRWALTPSGGVALTGALRERAAPRHIYLMERVGGGGEEGYSRYYAISDQLLWTPSSTLDVGLAFHSDLGERLSLEAAFALGGGSYELLTPLEGSKLDQGSLFTLSFRAGLHYEQPISERLTLKVSYSLQGQHLSPIGLPDGIERSFKAEGLDASDLSLSFGTIDLLHRGWLSVIVTLW